MLYVVLLRIDTVNEIKFKKTKCLLHLLPRSVSSLAVICWDHGTSVLPPDSAEWPVQRKPTSPASIHHCISKLNQTGSYASFNGERTQACESSVEWHQLVDSLRHCRQYNQDGRERFKLQWDILTAVVDGCACQCRPQDENQPGCTISHAHSNQNTARHCFPSNYNFCCLHKLPKCIPF